MTAFSTLEPAIASDGGELLLVQNGDPKRLPFSALGSGVPMSAAPPDDSPLWWQTDSAGLPLDLWMRGPGGLWLSSQRYSVSYFRGTANGNFNVARENPCPGGSIWLDSFLARALTKSQDSGARADFNLNFLNSEQKEMPFFYIRLEGAANESVLNVSESIAQPVAANDALAFRFRLLGANGTTNLKYVSMAVTLRKIYAES